MSDFILRSARFLARETMERVIRNGDRVIDATMGNGHDTLFLCQLVGESGHVYAFDVQRQAVDNTRKLLAENDMESRASLILAGHEHMSETVPGGVRAVMFNLGWLPGSDKTVTTHWQTTQPAILSALSLLDKDGVMTVCVYPGHAAGREELDRIWLLLTSLRPQEFNVLEQNFLNAGPGSPVCFVIQKQ